MLYVYFFLIYSHQYIPEWSHLRLGIFLIKTECVNEIIYSGEFAKETIYFNYTLIQKFKNLFLLLEENISILRKDNNAQH